MYLSLDRTQTFLRLIQETDINDEYLSWFSDPFVLKYISFASSSPSIQSLKAYVKSKIESPDCLFLGIYDSFTSKIIGTIKFEPIDRIIGSAEIGILIGSSEYRGKGIASDALIASINYVKHSLDLTRITLGVRKSNIPAVQLYKKLGFQISSTNTSSIRMTLIL